MDMKWHQFVTRWADSRGFDGREIDYQWYSPSFPVISIRSNLGRYSGQKYGHGSKPRVKTAVGLIAIGDVAVGLISIGAISVGVLSLGAISLGMWLAIGAIALSWLGFAVGAIAIAGVAVGAIAIAEKALEYRHRGYGVWCDSDRQDRWGCHSYRTMGIWCNRSWRTWFRINSHHGRCVELVPAFVRIGELIRPPVLKDPILFRDSR